MIYIQINKQINCKTIVETGGPISTFEWKLDDILQANNTDSLIIQPNTLSLGLHTIKFRGQNYCGNWSSEIIENINIIEAINMAYTQTDTLNVNAPTVAATMKLRRISTVTITVTDEADVPIPSAQVTVAGISGTTNATGVVTLSAVPYGAQTVTTTIP